VVTMQSNVQVQWSPRVKMRDISVRHKTCDSLDELSAKPHECCAKCRCRNSGSIMQKRFRVKLPWEQRSDRTKSVQVTSYEIQQRNDDAIEFGASLERASVASGS
jgi:hypothetical protein